MSRESGRMSYASLIGEFSRRVGLLPQGLSRHGVFRAVAEAEPASPAKREAVERSAMLIDKTGIASLRKYLETVVDPRGHADATERSLVALIDNRRLAVWATIEFSARDPAFLSNVQVGDEQRANRKWAQALNAYGKALALYPMHNGYRVQYAHMLKELGRFADAEAQYRCGLALGAPEGDVIEHLVFAARRDGHEADMAGLRAVAEFWKRPADDAEDAWSAPVTPRDVTCIADVMGARPRLAGSDIVAIMRMAPFAAEVAALIAAEEGRSNIEVGIVGLLATAVVKPLVAGSLLNPSSVSSAVASPVV